MSNLETLMVLTLVIPFVWSGLFRVFDLPGQYRRETQNDSVAKQRLALMLAPSFIGAVLFALVHLGPGNISIPLTLPAFQPDIMGETLKSAEGPVQMISHLPIPVMEILMLIYSVGALLLFVRLTQASLKLQHIVRTAEKTSYAGRDVLITLTEISPFAHISGQIVLPQRLFQQLPSEQLDLIVAHERCHLKRQDSVYYLILAVIDVLYWFNPFLRQQTRQCRLAAELACDHHVTSQHPKKRHDYATAMIATLELLAPPAARQLAPFLNRTTQGEFRMRIRSIISSKNPPKRTKAVRLAMVGAAACLLPVTIAQAALVDTQSGGTPTFSVMAVAGKITSRFGARPDPISQQLRHHDGVDIKAPLGTPVKAPASGTVVSARDLPNSYGLLLTIDHGAGYVTRYANLSAFKVGAGDTVRAGQIIAEVGSTGRSTGPHLHIEVIKDGDPIDPARVLILPAQD